MKFSTIYVLAGLIQAIALPDTPSKSASTDKADIPGVLQGEFDLDTDDTTELSLHSRESNIDENSLFKRKTSKKSSKKCTCKKNPRKACCLPPPTPISSEDNLALDITWGKFGALVPK